MTWLLLGGAGIAGYVGSSYYKQMEGSNWVRNVLTTCFIYCGPFFLMFCFNNTVAIVYRVRSTLPPPRSERSVQPPVQFMKCLDQGPLLSASTRAPLERGCCFSTAVLLLSSSVPTCAMPNCTPNPELCVILVCPVHPMAVLPLDVF